MVQFNLPFHMTCSNPNCFLLYPRKIERPQLVKKFNWLLLFCFFFPTFTNAGRREVESGNLVTPTKAIKSPTALKPLTRDVNPNSYVGIMQCCSSEQPRPDVHSTWWGNVSTAGCGLKVEMWVTAHWHTADIFLAYQSWCERNVEEDKWFHSTAEVWHL